MVLILKRQKKNIVISTMKKFVKNVNTNFQRHSDECNNCELGGYVERVEFLSTRRLRAGSVWKRPIGDRTNIERPCRY